MLQVIFRLSNNDVAFSYGIRGRNGQTNVIVYEEVFLNDRLTRNQQRGSVRRTTDAFELATAVLCFSPVQHFGLTPNNLDKEPKFVLDFLR